MILSAIKIQSKRLSKSLKLLVNPFVILLLSASLSIQAYFRKLTIVSRLIQLSTWLADF